ncbi:hypothetical protein BS78_06G283100, partial [Paspalum vaginatum]
MNLPSFECVMCDQGEIESLVHLFLLCPFARECWVLLVLSIPLNCSLREALESFEASPHVPFFMELIILMAWSVWIARNSFVFRGIASTHNSCLATFIEMLSLSHLRAKSSLFPVLGLWLD